jgi:tRNA-specific 2-thiouridylase
MPVVYLPLKKKDMNVAALISGGVDSAVAVHLLCEQGHKPDG